MLQAKIKEQEARSRQLERELEEMAKKHADAESQWRKNISSVNETGDVESRKERLDERDWDPLNTPKYVQGRLDKRNSQDKFKTSNDNEERLDIRDDQGKLYYDKDGKRRREPSDEHSHGQKSKGSDWYPDEIEGKHRRSRRHSSYTDADTEESYRDRRMESSRREGRGSRKSHSADMEVHWRDEGAESPTGDRKGQVSKKEKSLRKSRKTRERNVDSETVVAKTHAAVTEVQVVRDDELYRLSKGRIELLESEKAAFMELNTSLQEENKALKQLALSLQKGTGEI